MVYSNVTHVIFDLDGLLLDTENIYDEVIQNMANNYGKIYTLAMKLKVKGTPEEKTAAIVIEEMDLPLTVGEFLHIYRDACKELLQHPMLLPGAEILIKHLHKHKIPIAVATSGASAITETKMQNYKELSSLFHHIVVGSDPEVKNGKPSPDIYLVCCSRFSGNPPPEKCLVFEDAPNGVTGALKAGMQVVMVPDVEVSKDLCKNATLVLESLTEFDPELFGLPPFDD